MFAGQGDGHGAVIQDANVLRDHEGSAHHTAAVKKATTLSGGVGSISHGMKAISKHVNVATQGILPLLIMAAFWLVKEHVAGIKFASLLEFLTMAGVQGISKKYNNRRYFWSGLYACSEFLLCNVVTKVMMSPYFALLCDRGTDITTENHMLVYIRYLGMLSYSFVTTYLCCINVNADDSTHHTEVLLGIIDSLGIDRKKLIAICTDGASNYLGVHNGVQKQLREKLAPYIVGVHCSAHRTALVLNDAGSSVESLRLVDSLLTVVHGLFSHSHKRQQEWAAFAQSKGITKYKFPLYVKTRWLSRVECLDALCANLPVLLLYLDQFNSRAPSKKNALSWPTAVNVKKRLMGLKAVSTLFLVLDMLQPIMSLCLRFQSGAILPHEVDVLVANAVQQLEEMFINPESLRKAGLGKFKAFCSKVRKNGAWEPSDGVSINLRKCSLTVLHADMKQMACLIKERFAERFQSNSLLFHSIYLSRCITSI
jgi:hypothetical protein